MAQNDAGRAAGLERLSRVAGDSREAARVAPRGPIGASALRVAAILLTPAPGVAGALRVAIRPPACEVAFDATTRWRNVHARFHRFDGELTLDPDNLAATHVHLVLDAASLDSGSGFVDRRLRGPDFFDVARFATIAFDGVRVSERHVTGERSGAFTAVVDVVGRFTLRDVTHEVTFPSDVQVTDDSVTVRGEFTIRMADYGITYQSFLNPVEPTARITFVFRGARDRR